MAETDRLLGDPPVTPSLLPVTSDSPILTTPSNPTPFTKPTPRPYHVREATWRDAWRMGALAWRAYDNNALSDLWNPHRHQYPDDCRTGYQRRALQRIFNPLMRSYVAVSDAEGFNKGEAIGYVQFCRAGPEGSRGVAEVRREASRWYTTIRLKAWELWMKFADWAFPNRAEDQKGLERFFTFGAEDQKKHFDAEVYPSRQERWYVQSCIVSEEWRCMGVGKALLKPALERAEREGLPVALEASADGERLYRSAGFELLDRFLFRIIESDAWSGGVMMWKPSGWDEREDVKAEAEAAKLKPRWWKEMDDPKEEDEEKK
jgi:ribosomal protein S18 acetylase RimI-like enzyme